MELQNVSIAFERALEEIGKVVVGQSELVEGVLVAVVCGGKCSD